jgi:glycosyltransferase involved in cell wall biosynthesis
MKKKIAIIPDIKGWVIDNFANNIIKVLSNEFDFTKFYMEGDNVWKYEYEDKFDIIYMMLPSYLKKNIKIEKYRTSFHGGPGIEGQADQINRFNLNGIRTSYVATQVKERLKKYKLKNSNYFTPYGVNPDEYNITHIIKNDKIKCGYAGWISYILDNQRNHRRIYWIVESQKDLKFDMYFAGGLEEYVKNLQKDAFHEKFKKINNIYLGYYSREQMKDFYSKINCYLVPDKYAGGPMPVIEAGIMGIPSITTNAGLCGDIIKDKENGLLISGYSKFLNAIKFLMNNPDERIRLGNNMRNYVLENRTWEKVKNYWKIFLND